MLILSYNLSFLSSDAYNQNPLDWLLVQGIRMFQGASIELSCALDDFFEENSIALKENHWTIKVQRAFTLRPSSKRVAKKRRLEEIPALNLLFQKSSK